MVFLVPRWFNRAGGGVRNPQSAIRNHPGRAGEVTFPLVFLMPWWFNRAGGGVRNPQSAIRNNVGPVGMRARAYFASGFSTTSTRRSKSIQRAAARCAIAGVSASMSSSYSRICRGSSSFHSAASRLPSQKPFSRRLSS